jgi:hypothetical protein
VNSRPFAIGNAGEHACRIGVYAALGMLLGIVASGPLAVGWVDAVHPQPHWQGPEAFARHYHPLQTLPYAGGILLVLGLLLLFSSLHALARGQHRVRANLALCLGGVFATFIFANYTLQTTYVPALAQTYAGTDAPLLSALSMSNPQSLAWALEMWGWGFSGLATWLFAPVFQGTALERATRGLFVANGVVSVAGTVWTVAQPGWVMTPAGLAAFASWNVLLAVLAVLTALSLRARIAVAGRSVLPGAESQRHHNLASSAP